MMNNESNHIISLCCVREAKQLQGPPFPRLWQVTICQVNASPWQSARDSDVSTNLFWVTGFRSHKTITKTTTTEWSHLFNFRPVSVNRLCKSCNLIAPIEKRTGCSFRETDYTWILWTASIGVEVIRFTIYSSRCPGTLTQLSVYTNLNGKFAALQKMYELFWFQSWKCTRYLADLDY